MIDKYTRLLKIALIDVLDESIQWDNLIVNKVSSEICIKIFYNYQLFMTYTDIPDFETFKFKDLIEQAINIAGILENKIGAYRANVN